MPPPKSPHYKFIELISQNSFWQAWHVKGKKDNKSYFVKVISPDNSANYNSIRATINDSFKLQQNIQDKHILSMTKYRKMKNSILLEYEYLDPNYWRPINHHDWQMFGIRLLIKIFYITDLLHLFGIVHCDLKTSNFLINRSQNNVKLKLIDLDFLMANNSNPDHIIFGTGGFIAPEVLNNDKVTYKSDAFSLGRSLSNDTMFSNALLKFPEKQGNAIRELLGLLKSDSPKKRPMFLLKSLFDFKLVNYDSYQMRIKRILITRVMHELRISINDLISGKESLENIVNQKCKIFGLQGDFMQELQFLIHANVYYAVRILIKAIKTSQLAISGSFFQIHLSDNEYLRLFMSVSKHSEELNVTFLSKKSISTKELDSINKECTKLIYRNNYFLSFLVLSKIFSASRIPRNKKNRPLLKRIYKTISNCAKMTGRTSESLNYYTEYVTLLNDNEIVYDHLNHIIRLSFAAGNTKSASKYINMATNLNYLKSPKTKFSLSLHKVWLLCQQRKYTLALRITAELLNEAKTAQEFKEITPILVSIASIYQLKGDNKIAQDNYEKALSCIHPKTTPRSIMAANINLIYLFHNTAQYKKAIEQSDKALKYCGKIENETYTSAIAYTLIGCYTRLGKYNKAEIWLNKFIECNKSNSSGIVLAEYHMAQGLLNFTSGKYYEAESDYHNARDLLTSKTTTLAHARLYRFLSLLKLYQGDFSLAKDYSLKSKDIYDSVSDNSSIIELRFVELIIENYVSGKWDHDLLLSRLKLLIDAKCYYYAALCVFHVLTFTNKRISKSKIKFVKKIVSEQRNYTPPIIKALSFLLERANNDTVAITSDIIKLKKAYQILQNSKQYYYSLIICERIANYYNDSIRPKIAGKFYKQAMTISELLQNTYSYNKLSKKLNSVSETDQSDVKISKLLTDISNVFSSYKNSKRAIDKLVEISVELTGAERGVLFLRSQDLGKLQVKSFVNCDKESLGEIKSFSKTIPLTAMEKSEPLLIKNAMEDARTKNIRSIIALNVLSVICIPIEFSNDMSGVLYLDHHTIPALFKQSDYIIVNAISKLMSASINSIREYGDISASKKYLEKKLSKLGEVASNTFITENEKTIKILSEISTVASSDAEILVHGESGTGKEIICNIVHSLSGRSNGPLIRLNCAAIPDSLAESELFGLADKTATDARQRSGLLEAADGGTLFLDEIGDLSPAIQAKMLRAVEYQEFKRPGSNQMISVDVRFIFATNRDLETMIVKGEFRGDLLYRINTFEFTIPPLRERIGDVPALIEHFMKLFEDKSKQRPIITEPVLMALANHDWPGNVRELKNLIRNFCLRFAGKKINVSDLPDKIALANKIAAEPGSKQAQEIEKAMLIYLLKKNNWNQSAVARILGVSPATIHRKIKYYGITRNS